MCQVSKKDVIHFPLRMNFVFLLLFCCVKWCCGAYPGPMESNEFLKRARTSHVAEWQWESWAVKQDPFEPDKKSPGPRMNVALWKDTAGQNYYLFGGQPLDTETKKIYSDVWKYSADSKNWERFFPPQLDTKGAKVGKIGGMMTLRANLFDESHISDKNPKDYKIILCGGITKTNTTKIKKPSIWNNFTRKKKEEEPKKIELKSLAVYAPKTSKSNTVWQIDVKDKLWTAYVCCCDNTNSRKDNATVKVIKPVKNVNETKKGVLLKPLKPEKNINSEKNESVVINTNINKTEDEEDNEQQHLDISNIKNKKRKINQNKKVNEDSHNTTKIEKREVENVSSTKTPLTEQTTLGSTTETSVTKNEAKVDLKAKKEKYNMKMKDYVKIDKSENSNVSKSSNQTEKPEKLEKGKPASKYCPEFSENGAPVAWCDGNSEVLITADINNPNLTLWIFNLKTSHWSQQKVKIPHNVTWPGCSTENSVRYAGNEEEVYLICSPHESQHRVYTVNPKKPRNTPQKPYEEDVTLKYVYRINYKQRTLDSLGNIKLSTYFNTDEGRDAWQNDSLSVVDVKKTADNMTILLLTYTVYADVWILSKNKEGREYFDPVESVWRGSALKWFRIYNSPLYNLQFVTESGKSETVLIPNPRVIFRDDYWYKERGRFKIRIFNNEKERHESYENRTREHNLTYELLQSDYKAPATENQVNYAYNLKVLVFFGISLAIFTVFGIVVFLRKCVNFPPKIGAGAECQKSPLVIRYSVIPDDLLYPVG